MKGGYGGDICEELLYVEPVCGEGFLQVLQGVRTVGSWRLFDGVVEQMADEGALAIGLGDDVVDDVAWAGEAEDLVVLQRQLADGIDGFVFVFGAPAADGVEVFQAESKGIDHGMAGHTGAVAGEFGDFFAHGEAGFEVTFFKRDGDGRVLEGHADDVAGEEHAPMDGGGGAGGGESGEEVRVGDDAGPLFGIEADALEFAAFHLFAIELGEAVVEVKVVGLEQLAVIGFFAPDGVLDKELEGGAEVGEGGLVEGWEGFGVFAGVFGQVKLQPMVEKAVHLGPGAGVSDETLSGTENICLLVKAFFFGGLEEAFVGNGIPQGEGQATGDGEVVWLFAIQQGGVEEAG